MMATARNERRTVMVVEDERIVALNLRQRLDQMGYDVVAVASSGDQALAAAEAKRPELVLMDIRIEGPYDGIETARRLNARGSTPVVYLTAHSEDGLIDRASQTRAYGYLLKPFSEREMRATLQMAFARRDAEIALEEAETHAREELEARVRERTQELHESMEELRSFSRSVAHDLRAPLRAMIGMATMLREDHGATLSPAGSDLLQRLLDSGDRMGHIIDGLLALARLSRRNVVRVPVDLAAEAGLIAQDLRAMAPAREVEFVVAPTAAANADADLVRILLDNLLSNAWKFTSRHATAHVEFGVESRGDETIFFVSDDGAGFDMKYAGNLFQPFHRLHTGKEFLGDGIGLATVQRIVARHGGRVWAESAVERGTTVYFTLAPSQSSGVATNGGNASA